MRKSLLLPLLSLLLLLPTGCSEKIDKSARYVFQHETALSYLEKHEQFSQYVELLQQVPVSDVSATTISQLLSARGNYTVFAPTNEAIQTYLDTLCQIGMIPAPSFDAFEDSLKLDSIRRVIVYNSIIDSGDDESAIETVDFPNRSGNEIERANMNDRKLTVYYRELSDSILIFNRFSMNERNRDIYVLNGFIHQMDDAIVPRNITARDYLQEVIDLAKPPFLTMARLLSECGLFDTLSKERDEVYERLYRHGQVHDLNSINTLGFHEGGTAFAPEHRKYGFTIFAETDDFWREQGIDPQSADLADKVQQWVLDNKQYASTDRFSADKDYTSPQNLLYQWVTYHLLPMRIPSNRLVIHHSEYGYSLDTKRLGIPVWDFYTTMGQPRLLKVYESRATQGVCLNRFPYLNNGRKADYQELSCPTEREGSRVMASDPRAVLSDVLNCNIYPIDRPLAYTDDVRAQMQRYRIRFDGMTMFPEAMNNDIRKMESSAARQQQVYIPDNSIYPYFENMWVNEGTNFVYFNAYGYNWCNLYSDEMKAVGRFEMTFRLPPVPRAGIYELRYGFNANEFRGIVQAYFGPDLDHLSVTGIPIDLRSTTDWVSRFGYEPDTEDTVYNAELDKRMRFHNYMKGPMADCMLGNTARTARIEPISVIGYVPVRCIIARQFMRPDQHYYVRMKSVSDQERKEFQLDYFEWCAKEVYDNPEVPEDIW